MTERLSVRGRAAVIQEDNGMNRTRPASQEFSHRAELLKSCVIERCKHQEGQRSLI